MNPSGIRSYFPEYQDALIKVAELQKQKRYLRSKLKEIVTSHRMYDAIETAKEAIEKTKKA